MSAALIAALRETLRLFYVAPLQMLAVVYCQLTFDKDGAQKRLRAILENHPKSGSA